MHDKVIMELSYSLHNLCDDNSGLLLREVTLRRTHCELAQRLFCVLCHEMNVLFVFKVVDQAQVRLGRSARLQSLQMGHGQLFDLLERALRDGLEHKLLT